jgi:hypothetical protein
MSDTATAIDCTSRWLSLWLSVKTSLRPASYHLQIVAGVFMAGRLTMLAAEVVVITVQKRLLYRQMAAA